MPVNGVCLLLVSGVRVEFLSLDSLHAVLYDDAFVVFGHLHAGEVVEFAGICGLGVHGIYRRCVAGCGSGSEAAAGVSHTHCR